MVKCRRLLPKPHMDRAVGIDQNDAMKALEAARAAGVMVRIEGNDLILRAPARPVPAVLHALSRYKAEIIALMQQESQWWSVEDWRAFFNERAGIAEFDGGRPRAEAEAQAFTCCVVEWLNRNSVRSSPERCFACGDSEHAHDPVLPYGVEPAGYCWLHSRRWPAWSGTRESEAVAALAAMAARGKSPSQLVHERQQKFQNFDREWPSNGAAA
jgi:hypothetical protein